MVNPHRKELSGDKMRVLRSRYLNYLDGLQELFSDLGEKLKASDLNAGDHAALLEVVHKLSGTGATYGFPKISQAARNIEDLLTTSEWPSKALLTMTPEAGMNAKEFTVLQELVGKLILACDGLGFKRQGAAAGHLAEVLAFKLYVPRETLAWHINSLMKACAAAHTDQPVDFEPAR